MAGNTNTLSKKTIVAIVIAIVLLFVASLSVGIFLANRGDAEAAGGNQISDVNQTENNNQNTSSDNNQAPAQNTNIENNNTDSNNTENNNTENNNPETPNTDGNAGTVVDNNKTTNNNTNNNGTVNNAENNTENRTNNNTAGVTTDANVNQVGETTVTRVEERERLVSRDYWDWWTPTSVAVASTATRLSPTTPDITVEKVATTEAGKNVVYAGQKITYTITVKNSGNKDVEKIEVTDKIPSNTTFESVENDGTVIKSENEEILGVKWLVNVKAGETTSVKFTVIVNENIEGTISNVAVANGEESNEENTAIITSEKTSEISRDGQKVEIAKVGDEIKYTITVNNTGKVDGITTISDKVPEGTELKANSAEGAKISDNNDMLLWENINVPAEGTISKSFVVIVKNIDSLKANKISNVATVGGKDTNPTEDTAATDITVTKVWKNMDSDAAKANIIDSIKLQLKANGEVANEAVVTADEDWTHTFTDLPMYDENENKITYTIDEVVSNIEDQSKLGLYNKSIENGVITNTFDPSKLTDTTEVSATKVWANMDSDAARANTITSIKLQVKANGEVAAEQVVTAENNWTYTFKDLPVYDKAGNRITYTIDEVVANNDDQTKLGLYVKTIDQAKGIITNTFDPSKLTDTTEVTATKAWANMNSDAARTNTITSIKLQVKANGEVAAEQVVTAENNWTYTFKDLPVYDKTGNKITYTIDEAVANNDDQTKLGLYVKTIDQAKGIITNTFDPSKLTDTTEVSATKVWANMNSDAAKANKLTSIKLQVKNGDMVVAEQVVTANEDWKHTFTELPLYDENGNRITYTIDETVANNDDQTKLGLYVKTIDQAKGIITNTFDPSKLTDKTEVSATKVWANMNSDAARTNTITSIKLQVKANGEVAAEQVVTAENNWTYTFKDLPVYDEAGNRITYTIDEAVANNDDQTKLGLYVKTIDQAKGIITNTFDPSKLTEKTKVTATKAWANMDSDAAKANKLTSIKLQVKNGDTVVKEKEVTEKDNWTYTFTDLPVYDEAGNRITYTIDETVANNDDQAKLDLYDKSIENGVITNTFKPERVTEKTDITMTKIWEDNNNKFNTRPDSIILTVNGTDYKVEGTKTADSKTADSWSRTEKLPKYDAEGKEISYTATENTVPTGYEKVSEEGLTVTNRANELISKTAYKAAENGDIGNAVTDNDTFAANETVYYRITLTNAGSEPISKTVTDEIPLRLTLNTVDGKSGTSGTTVKGDNWTVTKNDKEQSVVTWEVKDLAAGETRELIIKATVVAEAEYKDICNKTIDGTTAYTAKLFVRKDGKVPYEGSGTGYDASLYTGELGTVYLNSSDLHYDTNANLKNDDLYYLIKNNNIITDMVAKGITRTQLVDALKTNGTTLADDEVVVWYVIKNESDGYHVDGVIRKISSLTEITNTAFTDKVSSDSTIKLEDIEIGQRGSVTVKSVTASTDTVSTPMDVVFVLDTSGSMIKNSSPKASNMVKAVNSSIKNIMSKNPDSRIGIVTFSEESKNLLPLGNYGTGKDYLTLKKESIIENVKENKSVKVTGGTNTQSGIKSGAEMLTNVTSTTATVTLKDGTTKTITRTPLLILVTDGEPTYYYASKTATGKVNGHGYTSETDENYYYWTLITAKYYKDQITNKYYQKTDKTAKVFTIGLGLDGREAVAMLDPTTEKVNACNNKNSTKQQKALYKLITNNGKVAPGAYSYANGSKTGEIEESDLTGFLNTSIDSSLENEENRAITVEESKARRVELGTINEEKEFSLTVGTDSYTSLKAAMNAGYVKKATSTTYYLDLSEISRSTNVEIVYWN